MKESSPEPEMDLSKLVDPLCLVVSRQEVDSGETGEILKSLKRLMLTPEAARAWHEKVDIAFHGYDEVRWELFEIPEVRNYVLKLDEQFPYWLFFLTKQGLGLQCIALCLLPPFLTEEAKARIHPQRLGGLLMNRWIPAMNQLCAYVGMSETEISLLTEECLAYFTKGRLASPEMN